MGCSCGSRPRATTSSTVVANGRRGQLRDDGEAPGHGEPVQPIHPFSCQLDGARGRPQQAGDDPEEGGLAGAVGPDDRDPLPGVDLDGDVTKRRALPVKDRDAVEPDHSS